ncbi:MAG: GatB/YqeY domain-containing protein [Bacteroidetes bacterium]|nr:GatB/YqeY domain-containing protein [Bacteroidota bacterium]
MSLDKNMNEALKDAMKAKDQVKLRTLRAIKAAFLLAKTAEGGNGQVSEEDELKIIQKLYKQRSDSYDIYVKSGRDDLATTEKEEMDVIAEFLPKQLDDTELSAEVKKIIDQVGASSMQDMGKVMGMASKALQGKADGKRISAVVKQLLS